MARSIVKATGLTAAALAVAWLGFLGFVYMKMKAPPEQFGAFMSKLPAPFHLVLPFQTLWFRARAGTRQCGQCRSRFCAEHAGQIQCSAAVILPRIEVRGACVRQLHMTAIPPGGSRAQQALRTVPGPGGVLHRVHTGGAPQRRLANGVECSAARRVPDAPEQ